MKGVSFYGKLGVAAVILLMLVTVFPVHALYDEKECVLAMDMDQFYSLNGNQWTDVSSVLWTTWLFDQSPERNYGRVYPSNDSGYYGPSKTFGYYGYALEFDGVDDYVDVPDDTSLDLSSTLTMMAWIKIDAWPTTYSNILSKAGQLNPYALYLENSTNAYYLRAIVTNSTGSYVTPGVEVTTLNTWRHVAATYNGTFVNLYVDGELEVSSALSGAIKTNAFPLYVGADDENEDTTADSFFSGVIDDLRVYPFALSDDDIYTDMLTPVDQYYTHSFSYYHNDDDLWTTTPVSGVTGRYLNDPWSPWVNTAATGKTDARVKYVQFIPGFQNFRQRATFYSNKTGGGGDAEDGFRWEFYFFKDGVWQSMYRMTLSMVGLSASPTQWNVAISNQTHGETPRLHRTFPIQVSNVVNYTQWNWCVDAFTSEDGTQFVMRITTENTTYLWDGDADRWHFEYRIDLVDDANTQRPLDWFDPYVCVEFRVRAYDQFDDELMLIGIPYHRAGLIGNVVNRVYTAVTGFFQNFIVPTVKMVTSIELPSLPKPAQIIEGVLEGWKLSIMDIPQKLMEGFLFVTRGLQQALTSIPQVLGSIQDALGLGQLNLFSHLVTFLDSIFAWTGTPNAVSTFLSWIASGWQYTIDSFTYLFQLLAQFFIGLAAGMSHLVQLVTHMVTYWVQMFTKFKDILTGTFGSGLNLWTGLIAPFVPLLIILYPLYLCTVWIEKGSDAVWSQLQILLNVASFLIHIFIQLAQLIITTVAELIEKVPLIQ